METKLKSTTKEVIIGGRRPTVLIGERINPTGKKRLTDALKNGNLDLVSKEAISQIYAGADILDINVGALDADEVTLLPQVVQKIMDTVDIPLCIDSANPVALEAALKVYRGKPLVNSVTGEDNSLKKILPLIKKYKASVIGLTMDDKGIPNDVEQRVAIAHRIVEKAAVIGIPREDIIIDCLTLAIGADDKAGTIVIDCIRKVKDELGVNLTLGASNISFGLPDRNLLNNTFITIAIAMGVTCLIVDVAKVRPAVLAAELILGYDKYARRYIKAYQQRQDIDLP